MKIDFITRDELQEMFKDFETRLCREKQRINKNTQTFYTSEELSKKLKVCTRTLQNWRDKGLIDFYQIGNNIIYSDKMLEDFLEKYQKKSFV
ncbi:helix-turn-helix domain-containing protein [Nostoc sp. CHAB 5834]|nr:helix-turn-helix domain-containing protein [Nostoc sp. CHAB 5834]